MPNPFKLLVFDWDGTLMDSQARIIRSFVLGIQETGLESRTPTEIRYIIGLGLDEAVAELFPHSPLEVRTQLVARYRYHYIHSPVSLSLFPGVEETLRQLAADGYWLAVATGKSRRGLDLAMTESGLTGLFHSSRCADEANSKPHPQMLEEIMQELAITPAETLMIGDTEYDIQMAHNAKVAAVAVAYGTQDKPHLLAQHPLVCLDSLPELLPWLHNYSETS
ncbi:MAG: HAD family hydrolase [Beggiatoa sp. IS2]|nr:MAG: HAD family hydrolase [Beggiatoa sp. IS2]